MGGKEEKRQRQKDMPSDLAIPTAIFLDRKASILESLAVYLKEEHSMNYAQIGRATNRDERNIWTAYNRAKKKQQQRPKIETSITFPLRIVTDRSRPIFESIIKHLREQGIKNKELAKLFNRKENTLTTIYRRAIRR